MLPVESLPQTEVVQTISFDFQNQNTVPEWEGDEDLTCFCGQPLVTENERRNCTCYSCFAMQECELVLENFSEVESILRSVLHISLIVEHDLRTDRKSDWQHLVERVRDVLVQTY